MDINCETLLTLVNYEVFMNFICLTIALEKAVPLMYDFGPGHQETTALKNTTYTIRTSAVQSKALYKRVV